MKSLFKNKLRQTTYTSFSFLIFRNYCYLKCIKRFIKHTNLKMFNVCDAFALYRKGVFI